jgi:GNAT superfamily N-acetyltransferase
VDVVPVSLSSPEEHLRAWHRLHAAFWREEMPDVDPVGERESRADLEGDRTMERHGLLAVNGDEGTGDEVIGAAAYELPLLEDLDVAWVNVVVSRAHRRKGVGRQLLGAVADLIRAAGRSRIVGDARVGGPGEPFASSVGARVTQVDVGSLLDVHATNTDELRRLSVPSPSYRLVQWRDRCPDDLVDRYAVARTAMNDAPHGDEHHDDWDWDADRVRELELRRVRWQVRTYTAAAMSVETGDIAGFTDLLIVDRPTTAAQEDTGVLAAHRGHGLGLAIKAANLLVLREQEPQIRRVMTWNAEDNRHMRAVNERLGFRVSNTWLDLSLKL